MNFLYQQGNIIVVNTWHQEPVTQSEQLQCSRVTAFLPTSLFFNRFWGEFRIPFEPHKPVGKTKRPKNGILTF